MPTSDLYFSLIRCLIPADRINIETSQTKLGVIYGGRSGEHEVSIVSAKCVLANADSQLISAVPIYLDRENNWRLNIGPDETELSVNDPPTPIDLLSRHVDIIFPLVHGTLGEDGSLQGMLEVMGIPYIGCGVTASAVGMDKAIFKHVMQSHGLPVLPWQLVTLSEYVAAKEAVARTIENSFDYPIFCKPANLGSSIGITRCENQIDLVNALELAFQYDHRVVVEQGIQLREIEIAVLGNESPLASTVGEIRPTETFYDYESKYQSHDTELLIPAPLSLTLAKKAQELAIEVYKAIDGSGLGRVDLFLTGTEFYVNEINTIPGFTEMSMFPKLWSHAGLTYPHLIKRLVDLGMERHSVRRQLKRTCLP